MNGVRNPPRAGRWLLRTVLPEDARDDVIGDLDEVFVRTCAQRGPRRARLWYWKEVASFSVRFLAERARLSLSARGQDSGLTGRPTPGSVAERIADFGTELRQVARGLRRRAGFSTIAVLTLALGLGASTAIYSVVRGVLLRPLPYPDPEGLVTIRSTNSEWQTSEVPRFRNLWDRGYSVSMMDYRDWLVGSHSLDAIGAYQGHDFVYSADAGSTRIAGVYATAGLFSALAVQPRIGRVLGSEGDQLGAAPSVVLSHGLWVEAFASAADVVGRTIRLDDESYTVIGVMPSAFYFPDASAQLWTNFGDQAKQRPRGWGDLSTIARLADGMTLEAARLDMSAVAARIAEANPDANNGDDARLTSRLGDVVGHMRTRLLLLAAAVALVQLIACANLANLLLVRAAERSGEIAVRAALGSTRWRLVRHVLLESMTLAGFGGALGILVAMYAVSVASTSLPADIPRLGEIRLDASVLVFSLALTLITGLVTGLLPALRVGAIELGARLREATSDLGAGRRKSWVQQGLVIAEISAAFALLIGSGVLVKSLVALTSVDRGFESEGIATLQLDLPEWSYPDDASVRDFVTSLVERLDALPGVSVAGATGAIPLADPGGYGPVVIRTDGGQERVDAALGVVTPGYFEALGIPVRAGRVFELADQRAEFRVAVISEAAAEQLWPGEDAIGKELMPARNREVLTVVGIVADVRHESLTSEAGPKVYMPSWLSTSRQFTAVVRTTLPVEDALTAARERIRELDSDLPISRATTMSGLLRRAVAVPRFQASLLVALASVALALAVGGIFAVVSYSVERRTDEIGLRIALGARRERIIFEILRNSLYLCLIGLAVGQGIALLAGGIVQRFLFEVSALDSQVVVLSALVLASTVLVASAIPAWRASGIDPVLALRSD